MKFKTETSAGGIVYKKQDGKVVWLITQHSKMKSWSFPKGLIGDKVRNEPKEIAALREVEEEGGVKAHIVDPKSITVSYMYRFGEYLIRKTVYYFLMEYDSGNPKDHDWEVSEAKFVGTNEARSLLAYKGDKEAFEKAKELVENVKV